MPLMGLTDHWVIKISFRVHMTQLSLPTYPSHVLGSNRFQGSNLFRTPELHIAMLLPAPPSAALGRRVAALGSAETTLIDPQTSCCSHVLRSIHCASCIPSTNFWQCQTCQTLDGEASARTFPSKLRWDWTFACLIGFSPLDQWNGCRMLVAWDVLKLDVWHKKTDYRYGRYGSKDVKTLADPWPWDLCFDPNMVNSFGWFNWSTNWSSMVPLGSTNGIPYLFTDDHWFNWMFIPRSTNGHQWSHFCAKSAHFWRQPEDGISPSGSHTVTPEVALRFCKLRRWGLHPEFKPGMENDWSLTEEVSSNNETYYGKSPFFDKKFQTRYISIQIQPREWDSLNILIVMSCFLAYSIN